MNSLQRVTSETDCSRDFVRIVAEGYTSKLRDMPQPGGAVMMALKEVAKLYGMRKEPEAEVLKESIKLVLDKFSYIAAFEIKEAYRQWSTGEIEVKGAEMYGGEFNVAQFGKILGAYTARRKKVLGVYLREKEAAEEAARAEQKKRIMQEAFDTAFPHMIENAKSEIEDWRDVPTYWYQSALDRDMIKFEQGEAVQIFKDAQELEKVERQAEQEDVVMTLNDIFKQTKIDPLERAKVIARKLTVFRKLIQTT